VTLAQAPSRTATLTRLGRASYRRLSAHGAYRSRLADGVRWLHLNPSGDRKRRSAAVLLVTKAKGVVAHTDIRVPALT
jgi:hypothetical protein